MQILGAKSTDEPSKRANSPFAIDFIPEEFRFSGETVDFKALIYRAA